VILVAPVRAGAAPGARRVVRGLAATLLAAACACGGGPEPIHVRAVRLAHTGAAAPLDEAGLDGAAVEDAVRTALAAAGFRTGDGSRPHVAAVDLAALRVVPDAGGPGAEVTLEIVLTPAQPGGEAPRRETAAASVPLASAATPRDAWRRALAAAAMRSAEGIAIGLRAESKKTDGLVADLGSKDLRIREQAVRVLGERRAREAVPALLDQLKREDSHLAHRVVAALAQIGDPRAVPALIDLSQSTDPSLALRLLRYIGDIGGGEAQGYLLTLASGHPDPRMRLVAREALEELEARAKEAPVAAARK
jgi:hypothetical protein